MFKSFVSPSCAASAATAAAFLFILVLIGAGPVTAAEPATADAALVVETDGIGSGHRVSSTPAVPPYLPRPQTGDAFAALEAVQIALAEVGDGATYVWRRDGGRLAGAFRPTATFRDTEGRICRHLEMRMRLGTYQRRTEGIACRSKDGVWELEG